MSEPDSRPPRIPPAAIAVVAVLLAAPVVALMWVSSLREEGARAVGLPVLLLVPVPLGLPRGDLHVGRVPRGDGPREAPTRPRGHDAPG
nr:hypothetical protein [Angustibacter aerolatus]